MKTYYYIEITARRYGYAKPILAEPVKVYSSLEDAIAYVKNDGFKEEKKCFWPGLRRTVGDIVWHGHRDFESEVIQYMEASIYTCEFIG